MQANDAEHWAHATFSKADLGDPRRVRRLLKMATAVAKTPGGTVTGTMATAAEAEGAFRFLESSHVSTEAVGRSVFEAAAVRCADSRHVFVAVDQTSLSFVDRKCVRGLGPMGNRCSSVLRGVQVMNSLALDEHGTPVGLLDQQWWSRPEERTPCDKDERDPRPPQQRESWKWVDAFHACTQRLAQFAPQTRPWFVMDRGADSHGVLVQATKGAALFTVRSSYDRVIEHRGRRTKLWSTLARQQVLGYLDVPVPAGPHRARRLARCELRFVQAKVRVSAPPYPEVWAELGCVRIREVSRVPVGEHRIEWKLLSTFPVHNLDDAVAVVRSYTYRWRVEEFHKTWKSGACRVEQSQLRSVDAIVRWSTILAAVAVRIERLKLLSREQPDLDACTELSREELDAAILLSKTKDFEVGCDMSLHDAVRLVAKVGGYLGRNGDGPPGSITIRRGLERITPAAQVLSVTRTSG